MIMTDAMKSALCDDFLVCWHASREGLARGVKTESFRLGVFMAELEGDQAEHLIRELTERLFLVTETLKAVQEERERGAS